MKQELDCEFVDVYTDSDSDSDSDGSQPSHIGTSGAIAKFNKVGSLSHFHLISSKGPQMQLKGARVRSLSPENGSGAENKPAILKYIDSVKDPFGLPPKQ